MSFERAFKLSSYLLLVSGFAALLASSAAGPFLTGLFLAGLALHWRLDEFRMSGAWQAILFGVLLLLFVVDAAAFSGLVEASIHLLVLISLVKIFTVKGNRDYLLIYSISFTFLLIGSTYTISILFLVSLIVYFFFCILTFILFESKAAFEENRWAGFSLRSYLQVAALITGMIIALSVPIFLAIPRTTLGLFKTADGLGANLSGFSDKVNLGDIGRIIENRAVFMRVAVDRPPEQIPDDLKWRGIALDNFDGQAWNNTDKGYRQILEGGPPFPPGMGSALRFLIPVERRPEESLLGQTVTVEPSSRVIFGADRIVQVAGTRIPGASLLMDRNATLSFTRMPNESLRYTVYSDIAPRLEKLSRAGNGPIPADVRARYMQLPSLDPRIRSLAQQLAGGYSEPRSKALALESHLKSAYAYSLENRSAASPDPLAEFLFETRAGHCEYFATALAVMLRSVGIPSRVVNGFRLGEYNAWSNYFIVRQSDAHSWVEAYLPGSGWVELDATPARGDSESTFYLARVAGQFLDAVDVFWTEVVTFDRLKQISFFVSMGSRLRHGADTFSFSLYRLNNLSRRWWRELKAWEGPTAVQVILGLLAAALALGIWLGRRRIAYLWRKLVLRRSPAELAPEYYLELLEILRRKGFTRQPWETPMEFAARVGPSMDSPLPAQVTGYYYRSRYGNLALQGPELAEIRTCLRQLKSSRGASPLRTENTRQD